MPLYDRTGLLSRTMGTPSLLMPTGKRMIGVLSSGLGVAVIADANLAGYTGATDTSGTAKIAILKSSDVNRSVWTTSVTFSPAVAPCSSTIAAVISMAVDASDNLHVVWQGTDNSLMYVKFTVSGGTWTAGTAEVVIAANAVTKRFRAVDIDVMSTNPAIIVYESLASTGQGAWARVYVRMIAGTWVKAYESQIHSTAFIYNGSEDVSISYDTNGPVTNVARYLIFFTRTGTAADQGDIVREITFNVSTGTTNSATVVGTWPTFNQNISAGFRRGWIFKLDGTRWQVAMVCGLSLPRFQVMRLTHNAFSAPTVNSTTTQPWTQVSLSQYTMLPQINTFNSMNCVAASYNDNKVMFGFLTANAPTYINATGGYTIAGVVFGYAALANNTTSYIFGQMRPIDDYFSYGDRPIAIFGGCNSRTHAGDYKINFMCAYGYASQTVSGSFLNKLYCVPNNFFDAPEIIGPSGTLSNNNPTLQVRVNNGQLYPNVRGKIQWNLATDAAFTLNLKVVDEPDDNYRIFGSVNGSSPGPISVASNYFQQGVNELFSGVWYIRARVVDDLGQYSPWAPFKSFAVSHPPTALATSPSQGSVNAYGLGNITFAWIFNDTEDLDIQTAFRLVVTRVDTGASVLDTGKVTSTVQSTTQSISNTLLDLPLQWSVSLWDTDDVQGPFSNPSLFTVSNAPSMIVTSPTPGTVLASAMPTVTWLPTFFGGRTQKAFRVIGYLLNSYDDFARTVSAGSWSNSGGLGAVWNIVAGTASYFSVNGTSGLIGISAVNQQQYVIAGDSIQNVEVTAELTLPALALTQPIVIDVPLRYVGANDYSAARFTFNTSGSVDIRGVSVKAGVTTTTSVTTPTFTYSAATKVTLKANLIGTKMQAKIWTTSGAELPYWYFESDGFGYAVTAGDAGVGAILVTGNTNTLPFSIAFDNISIRNVGNASSFDSGWIQGTGNSYTFIANVLSNTSPYRVDVYVQDNGGLVGNSQTEFSTSWTPPVLPSMSTSTDAYGTTITWTNSLIDSTFTSWRIYRRYMVPPIVELDDDNTANLWVLVYENFSTSGGSYKDYLTPLNKNTDYVVVQVADRFGSLVESTITAYNTVNIAGDRYYFVPSVAIGSIASYEAVNIVSDNFTNEVEQETIHVIGRGRQVQVGDDLGASGTLSVQLRNAAAASGDRAFLERLASSKTINVYMKTPFGQVFYVKFGSIPVTRIPGVGVAELVDLQIPYTEVYDTAKVTRLS